MALKAGFILLAIVGGAHGIRGECRVRSFTEDPCDVGAYGPLFDARGNRFTVRSVRPQKNVVVVKFEEIGDRNAAEQMNGRELFVDRSVLPQPEEGDEFYLEDLVGLEAVDLEGGALGSVVAVHNFGAGDILELAPEKGATVMIPFSQAAVSEIDLEDGRIIVEPVHAGLVSDEDADQAAAPEGEGQGS